MTTIKIRIRVGVTADGDFAAVGGSEGVVSSWTYGADSTVRDDLCDHGEPVAWYWVEAEVPRPVTVDETVAGTVTP